MKFRIEKTQEKSDWMNDRMEENCSFEYIKGMINGERINIGIFCVDTKEFFPFNIIIEEV